MSTMLRLYIAGFIISLVLTILAFGLVWTNSLSSGVLLASVLALAFIQLVVQLFFFLHLGKEKKPRWQLLFFASTFGIVLIIVIASIIIVNNLNYNMTPQQINSYMNSQEGF